MSKSDESRGTPVAKGVLGDVLRRLDTEFIIRKANVMVGDQIYPLLIYRLQSISLCMILLITENGWDKGFKDCARNPCDLVTRMKDVSLYSQDDSVSFTYFDKDHYIDSAQSSDDSGNSSNESNTRPFYVVLEKKMMRVIKPSLMETEQRKEESK